VSELRSSLSDDRIVELCMRMEELRDDAKGVSTVLIAGDAYIAMAELFKRREADARLQAIERAAREVTNACMPRERDKAIDALRSALDAK
jgi:hypothetical protein